MSDQNLLGRRALVIAQSSTPGGAERYLVRLYSAFCEEGVATVVAGKLPGWPATLGTVSDPGLSDKWSRRTLPLGFLQTRSEIGRVVETAREAAPDWIHLQFKREQIAFTKALAKIAPVVWTEHGALPSSMLPLKGSYSRAAQHASNIICVSGRVAKSIKPLVGDTPVVVIENAVDTRHHAPVGAETRTRHRRRHSLGARDVVVLWVGRVDKGKRPDLALRYAQSNPDHIVLMMGSGTEFERIRSAALAVPNFRMLGYVEDPAEYYDLADALMFSSTGQSEGMPTTTIAEASAHDLPVVTHLGSTAEDTVILAGGLVVSQLSNMDEWRSAVLQASDGRGKGMRSAWMQQHSYDGWIAAHRTAMMSVLAK